MFNLMCSKFAICVKSKLCIVEKPNSWAPVCLRLLIGSFLLLSTVQPQNNKGIDVIDKLKKVSGLSRFCLNIVGRNDSSLSFLTSRRIGSYMLNPLVWQDLRGCQKSSTRYRRDGVTFLCRSGNVPRSGMHGKKSFWRSLARRSLIVDRN